MGCRCETRQTKANTSGQGTARLTRTKLPPHVRLNFREGQSEPGARVSGFSQSLTLGRTNQGRPFCRSAFQGHFRMFLVDGH